MRDVVLEPAAQEFADATAESPPPYELGVDAARDLLEHVQAHPVAQPDVEEEWTTVPARVGDVRARIIRPAGRRAPCP